MAVQLLEPAVTYRYGVWMPRAGAVVCARLPHSLVVKGRSPMPRLQQRLGVAVTTGVATRESKMNKLK